jgi:hypothetical protein
MTTATSCRKCGTPLPEPSIGRPRAFCGVGCRRAAEREVRRLDNSIAALEGRQLSHRESVAFGNGTAAYHEAKIAHLQVAIATAEARMRDLLDTGDDDA